MHQSKAEWKQADFARRHNAVRRYNANKRNAIRHKAKRHDLRLIFFICLIASFPLGVMPNCIMPTCVTPLPFLLQQKNQSLLGEPETSS